MQHAHHEGLSTGSAVGLSRTGSQPPGRVFVMPVHPTRTSRAGRRRQRRRLVRFGPFDNPVVIDFLVTSAISLGLLAEQPNDV